jgi:hypothetical protein
MKKLIAVVLLGLGAAQGVAVATENNTYTEPYWTPRKFMSVDATQYRGAAQGERNYDLVDRYNP